MSNRETFRKRLPVYMKRANINQRELSKAVGVSESTVHCWVTGKSFPRIDIIQKIADVLGCSTDDLLVSRTLSFPEVSVPLSDNSESMKILTDRIGRSKPPRRLFAFDAAPTRVNPSTVFGTQEVKEVTIDPEFQLVAKLWKKSTPSAKKAAIEMLKIMAEETEE